MTAEGLHADNGADDVPIDVEIARRQPRTNLIDHRIIRECAPPVSA